MDEFLAIIKIFGGNYAPQGWAFCQGQLLPISQNQALFSIIGTYYGGDGVNTFGLPDLRGRIPVGMGASPNGGGNYTIGQVGGTSNVTITVNNMPAHTHGITGTIQMPCNVNGSDTDSPEAAVPAIANGNIYSSTAGSETMQGFAATMAATQTGGSQPVSVVNPFLCVNYIICLQGLYPSRS